MLHIGRAHSLQILKVAQLSLQEKLNQSRFFFSLKIIFIFFWCVPWDFGGDLLYKKLLLYVIYLSLLQAQTMWNNS